MNKTYLDYRHDRYQGAAWPMIASGLWLRVGFVGASAVLIAVLRAFDGDVSLPATLLTVFAGAAVAAVSWRMGWQALIRADATEPAPTPATNTARPAYALGALQHD